MYDFNTVIGSGCTAIGHGVFEHIDPNTISTGFTEDSNHKFGITQNRDILLQVNENHIQMNQISTQIQNAEFVDGKIKIGDTMILGSNLQSEHICDACGVSIDSGIK